MWVSVALMLLGASPSDALEGENPTRRDLLKALAELTDPAQYPPAFNLGAQAEFTGPVAGVSSVVAGYDAIFMQGELSFGMGVGGDALANKKADDIYVITARIGLPVHRGFRADFSFLAGGGATIVTPAQGSAYGVGSATLGARFRIFQSPNLALAATLGGVAVFRGDNTSIAVGARPLGSAGVVYFFR